MLNVKKSLGSYISMGNKMLLDFHGGYGSNALGWNHPKLLERMKTVISMEDIINKPALSDFKPQEYFNFELKFRNRMMKKGSYYNLFFIDGGASAVENGLKVAMDWKCNKLGLEDKTDLEIVHFEDAFHGRNGYTLSLTNTDHNKVRRFTKFDWPRI